MKQFAMQQAARMNAPARRAQVLVPGLVAKQLSLLVEGMWSLYLQLVHTCHDAAAAADNDRWCGAAAGAGSSYSLPTCCQLLLTPQLLEVVVLLLWKELEVVELQQVSIVNMSVTCSCRLLLSLDLHILLP